MTFVSVIIVENVEGDIEVYKRMVHVAIRNCGGVGLVVSELVIRCVLRGQLLLKDSSPAALVTDRLSSEMDDEGRVRDLIPQATAIRQFRDKLEVVDALFEGHRCTYVVSIKCVEGLGKRWVSAEGIAIENKTKTTSKRTVYSEPDSEPVSAQ